LERERAEAELQQLVVDEPVVPQLSPPVSPLRDTEKKIPDSPQAENVVVSPKQPKTNTSSRARRKNENARKELVARLNSLSPPHPSPLLPINLLEQIHAIESAEKVCIYSALRIVLHTLPDENNRLSIVSFAVKRKRRVILAAILSLALVH